jgi:hypothetical protein
MDTHPAAMVPTQVVTDYLCCTRHSLAIRLAIPVPIADSPRMPSWSHSIMGRVLCRRTHNHPRSPTDDNICAIQYLNGQTGPEAQRGPSTVVMDPRPKTALIARFQNATWSAPLRPSIARASAGVATSIPSSSTMERIFVTCAAFDSASLPGPIHSESSRPTRICDPIVAPMVASGCWFFPAPRIDH